MLKCNQQTAHVATQLPLIYATVICMQYAAEITLYSNRCAQARLQALVDVDLRKLFCFGPIQIHSDD